MHQLWDLIKIRTTSILLMSVHNKVYNKCKSKFGNGYCGNVSSFTIETQDSFKRKLRTLILQKILCHSIKGTGLVSKYWLRLVSNNKSGAFFISFYFFSALILHWLFLVFSFSSFA
jgi:hypothetical protein